MLILLLTQMVVNLDGEQQMERKTAWRVLVCSKRKHINYLDLYAIKHAITNYREMWQGCKLIRIRSNNTTAIAYIHNMGKITSNSYNILAKEVWSYYMDRPVCLSVVHILGIETKTGY